MVPLLELTLPISDAVTEENHTSIYYYYIIILFGFCIILCYLVFFGYIMLCFCRKPKLITKKINCVMARVIIESFVEFATVVPKWAS